MNKFPRELTPLERDSVLLLLPVGGFTGVSAYRQQVDHVRVVGACDCGCPTIDLAVDRDKASRSSHPGNPLLPIEGHTPEGDEDPAELILFAREGWLESLELVWYTTPPVSLPPSARWEIRSMAR